MENNEGTNGNVRLFPNCQRFNDFSVDFHQDIRVKTNIVLKHVLWFQKTLKIT